MKNETNRRGTWVQAFSTTLTRNWQAKAVSVIVASLFWYMMKQQIRPVMTTERFLIEEHGLGERSGLKMDGPAPRDRPFIEEHGLRGQSGLDP